MIIYYGIRAKNLKCYGFRTKQLYSKIKIQKNKSKKDWIKKYTNNIHVTNF